MFGLSIIKTGTLQALKAACSLTTADCDINAVRKELTEVQQQWRKRGHKIYFLNKKVRDAVILTERLEAALHVPALPSEIDWIDRFHNAVTAAEEALRTIHTDKSEKVHK